MGLQAAGTARTPGEASLASGARSFPLTQFKPFLFLEGPGF